MKTKLEEKNRALEMGLACHKDIAKLFERLDNALETQPTESNVALSDEIEREIDESDYGVNYEKTYSIILAGGGPALRIFGSIDDSGEVETAELQYQDWFTKWERVPGQDEDLMIRFASRKVYWNN